MIYAYKSTEFSSLINNLKTFLNEQERTVLAPTLNDLSNTHNAEINTFKLQLINLLKIIIDLYENNELDILDEDLLYFHVTNPRVAPISPNITNIIILFKDNKKEEQDILILEAFTITFFADLYEYSLRYSYQPYHQKFYSFYTNVFNLFHSFSKNNIDNLVKVKCIIPSLCLHTIVNGDKLKTIKDLEQTSSEISKSLDKAKQLKQEIQTLKTYLETQKHEYNFVGLSNGFKTIQESKKGELDKETRNYHILFGAIIAVSVIKFCWLINNINEIDNMKLLGITIGVIMFLFILLYFFRITLLNIKSIKSQLLQIDLRLTLCQFIANYGTEIEKVNEKSRESFESVIFSPIVPTESQIPPTFDGMEQLTGFIGSIKKE